MRGRSRVRLLLWASIAVLAAGCDDPPPPPVDGGSDAGRGGEDAQIDAAPDGGPPSGPRFCAPCRLDAQCGDGNACLYFADRTSGCGMRCEDDGDCAGTSLPSTCVEPDLGGPRQCTPTAGGCVGATLDVDARTCGSSADCTDPAHPRCDRELDRCTDACTSSTECSAPYDRCIGGRCVVATAGMACAGDEECGGTFDRCIAGLDASGSVCTTACRSDADCPFLARRCVDTGEGAFCAPDRAASLDVCTALIAAGRATECGPGGICGGGAECVGEGAIRLCLMPVTLEGNCPPGSLPRAYRAGDGVCVPTVDSEHDVIASCECALAIPGSMLDEALVTLERDRCEVGFPTATFREVYEGNEWLADIAQDPFRLSFTDQVHGDWLSVPRFARETGAALDSDADHPMRPLTRTIARAAALADLRSVDASASLPPVRALGDALDDLIEATGGTVDRADVDAQVAALPSGMAERIAPLIDAVAYAVEQREAALAIYDATARAQLWALGPGLHLDGTGDEPRPTLAWAQGAIRGDVDVSAMARGAARIAMAIEDLDLEGSAGADATLTLETPRGRIAIRGSGDDTYEGAQWEETLLLLELGGDDTYRAPIGANASIDHGVAIAIDLEGTDTYAYVEVPVEGDVGPAGHVRLPSDGAGRVTPGASQGPSSLSNVGRQGSGRLGIGMLIDLGATRDTYRSLRMSQGYGALGVGVLWDAGGDDLYEGEAAVQGAASAGIGVLVDRAGADRYVTYAESQGFAFTRAVGLLYDLAGDDEYFSHPSDVLYWSPQDPGGSNSSFTQGAGFGRRADFSDGVYMSGGLGVLRDRAGADRYTTSIFGQATGYWFGTGLLLDAIGNDHYDGQWYVQAGNAHYALAALIDDDGNDVYNAVARRMNVAFGGGHDYSAAWLIDRAGDDEWHAPGLALGVGHAGGWGAMVDAAGTDTYESFSDFTFGHASIETVGDALRGATGSRGVFLERGGTDTYTRPTIGPVANDATWTQALHPPPGEAGENEIGAGIDRATGVLGIPGLPE